MRWSRNHGRQTTPSILTGMPWLWRLGLFGTLDVNHRGLGRRMTRFRREQRTKPGSCGLRLGIVVGRWAGCSVEHGAIDEFFARSRA